MSRLVQTYAPNSHYQSTEEFIRPTTGRGVEISVAWKERVIATYNFHNQGMISVGSHPDADIKVPLVSSFVDRLNLIKINYGIEVFVPAGAKISLGRTLDNGQFLMSPIEIATPSIHLQQKEILDLHLSETLKLVIRPSQATISPKIVPFLDLSSDGFLSLAFSVILSLAIALFVQLNPTLKAPSVTDEFYPTPLFLQTPERVAKILNPPKEKLKLAKPTIKKQISKVETVTKPVVDKISRVTKVSGNRTKAASLKKNQNKVKNQSGSKIDRGKSVKVSNNQGSQAKSSSLKNSKLFAVIGGFGQRDHLDTEYDGEGTLAGLANKATNSAGENIDREGKKFGSRFREAGSNTNGKDNVGVVGMSGGAGIGPGLGESSLGSHKSVSIMPSGEGAFFSGNIDREGIRKVFFDNSRAIRSCYERSLIQNVTFDGKLMLDFDIGPGGEVVGRPKTNRKASTFIDEKMSDCILGKLKNWRFPDPPSGQVVNVMYPLAFSSGK